MTQPMNNQPMDNRPIYVETSNGNYVNLADIDNIRVEPSDITVGLASITRYKGLYPVSVLRHSYAMYEFTRLYKGVTDENYLLKVLLHDAAEAYIGDIPAPTKRLSDVGRLESQVHNHILKFLMVDNNQPVVAEWPSLGYLDELAMAAELYIHKHEGEVFDWGDTCEHYGFSFVYDDHDLLAMVDVYNQIEADFCNDDFLAMHVENLIFRNMYKQGA